MVVILKLMVRPSLQTTVQKILKITKEFNKLQMIVLIFQKTINFSRMEVNSHREAQMLTLVVIKLKENLSSKMSLMLLMSLSMTPLMKVFIILNTRISKKTGKLLRVLLKMNDISQLRGQGSFSSLIIRNKNLNFLRLNGLGILDKKS